MTLSGDINEVALKNFYEENKIECQKRRSSLGN